MKRPDLSALPPTPEERMAFFGKTGQLFGWISGPDQLFMADLLPRVANEFSDPISIVEIGVFGGSTSRGLIVMTGGYLTGIDDWSAFQGEGQRSLCGHNNGPEFFWATMKNYNMDLSDHVKGLLSGNSQTIGEEWKEPIHLLLVDGDHSYEGTRGDLNHFCPHIVQGGYCLVDDMEMETVRQAVGEYFYNGEWKIIREPDISTTAKLFCARRN